MTTTVNEAPTATPNYVIRNDVPVPNANRWDGGRPLSQEAVLGSQLAPNQCVTGIATERAAQNIVRGIIRKHGKGSAALRKLPDGTYGVWRIK